jgi:hypothetical protein
MSVIVREREGNCSEKYGRAYSRRERQAHASKLEYQPEEEAAKKQLLDHWSGRTGQEYPLRRRDPSQGLVEDPGKPPTPPAAAKPAMRL